MLGSRLGSAWFRLGSMAGRVGNTLHLAQEGSPKVLGSRLGSGWFQMGSMAGRIQLLTSLLHHLATCTQLLFSQYAPGALGEPG